MRPHVRHLLLGLTLAAAGTMAGSRVTQAQGTAAPAPPPETLSALLTEVRGLRAAMEQMASAGPRIQLVFGRLQLQEQRVTSTLRRLDEVRMRVTKAEIDANTMQRDFRSIERLAREADDPAERLHSEKMLPGLKEEVTLKLTALQTVRNEEAALAQELSTEQARWMDFNQRLDELERSLGRR